MKASELDNKFDNNEEDILHAFALEQNKRPKGISKNSIFENLCVIKSISYSIQAD